MITMNNNINSLPVVIEKLKTFSNNIQINQEVKKDKIIGNFLPFYIDSNTMELKVILKHDISPGAIKRLGYNVCLKTLELELPEDKKYETIQEAVKDLDPSFELKNEYALGSLLQCTDSSDRLIENILIEISEPEGQRDEYYYIPFNEIPLLFQYGYIHDINSKILLNELYIITLEQSITNQQETISNDENTNTDFANSFK